MNRNSCGELAEAMLYISRDIPLTTVVHVNPDDFGFAKAICLTTTISMKHNFMLLVMYVVCVMVRPCC